MFLSTAHKRRKYSSIGQTIHVWIPFDQTSNLVYSFKRIGIFFKFDPCVTLIDPYQKFPEAQAKFVQYLAVLSKTPLNHCPHDLVNISIDPLLY